MNLHKAGSYVTTKPPWQTSDAQVAKKSGGRPDTTAPLSNRAKRKGKTIIHYGGQPVRLLTRDARQTEAISLINQGQQPTPGAVVTAGQHQVSTENSDLSIKLEALQKENHQLQAKLDNTKAELFLSHTEKDNIIARFDQYKAEREQAIQQAVLAERKQNQEESKATICKLQRKLETKEEKIKKMELAMQKSGAEKVQLTKQAIILEDLKKDDEEKIQQLQTDLRKIKCNETTLLSEIRALKESLQKDLQAKKIDEQNRQLEECKKQLIELKETLTACRKMSIQEGKKSLAELKKYKAIIADLTYKIDDKSRAIDDLYKQSASLASMQRKTEAEINAQPKPDYKKTATLSCPGQSLFPEPSKEEFRRQLRANRSAFEAAGFTAPKATDGCPGLQAMLIQMLTPCCRGDSEVATVLIHSLFEDVQRQHSRCDDKSISIRALFSQASSSVNRNFVVVCPGALDSDTCGYLFKPGQKEACPIRSRKEMDLTSVFDPLYVAYVSGTRTRTASPKPVFFPLEYHPTSPSANNTVGKPPE